MTAVHIAPKKVWSDAENSVIITGRNEGLSWYEVSKRLRLKQFTVTLEVMRKHAQKNLGLSPYPPGHKISMTQNAIRKRAVAAMRACASEVAQSGGVYAGDDREPLSAGNEASWGSIMVGTCLAGTAYPKHDSSTAACNTKLAA